jgi:hypothetical protein
VRERLTIRTFKKDIAGENIKAIKRVLRKKSKNLKKLEIFDEERVIIPSRYVTKKRYFHLLKLHDMCDASARVELEVKEKGVHVTALKLILVFKEIYDCKACIPIFKRDGKNLNIVDGIHRIYILHQLLKEENPKLPVLILEKKK